MRCWLEVGKETEPCLVEGETPAMTIFLFDFVADPTAPLMNEM